MARLIFPPQPLPFLGRADRASARHPLSWLFRFVSHTFQLSPHGITVTTIDSPLADALRDRYLLERELGRGGMATVYLAEDVRHRRQVAIKVLHVETLRGVLDILCQVTGLTGGTPFLTIGRAKSELLELNAALRLHDQLTGNLPQEVALAIAGRGS